MLNDTPTLTKEEPSWSRASLSWAHCCPLRAGWDSLVQEIEALKSAYVQELDSLWDELHALAKLPERAKLKEDEVHENTPVALRMQEYVDSICHWTVLPDAAGFTTEDEFVYHRYISILINQSDLGAWYLLPFMLEYFDEQSSECGIEFFVFQSTLCGYMKLRPVDIKPIIAQLAAISEGPRQQWLRRFANY